MNPEIYRKFGIITIVAVYLLIMLGGIVRSTGSGMGCPDWPKCFGQWVPPTHISQLPPDYKDIFKVAGKQIADFDPFKTWVEYVNRLIGVVTGLFIFGTMVLSLSFIKRDPIVFYLSFLSFLLVGFQGWLGSVVVATNLSPYMITLHMLLALVIVMLLIFTVMRSFASSSGFMPETLKQNQFLNLLLLAGIVASLLQIVLGTQVREAIDEIAAMLSYTQRDTWIEQIGLTFYIHRSFSLFIFALHLWFVRKLYQNSTTDSLFRKWAHALLALLMVEIGSGVVMAYFAIPALMQPLHLLAGSLICGVQFILLMLMNYRQVFKPAQGIEQQSPETSLKASFQ